MQEHDIAGIDIVVVNLYPFEATVEHGSVTDAEIVEQIDIGGPTLIRSAAKNFTDVLVVVDPDDYSEVQQRLVANQIDLDFRRSMAAKAFRRIADHDVAISDYMSSTDLNEVASFSYQRKIELRYGENPHQKAAFYVDRYPVAGTIASFEQHQGKELSYNNLADADAALNCVFQFDQPACVIVKHGNPCGVSCGLNPIEAYRLAFRSDPTSAFGGIIAFNRSLTPELAKEIIGNQFVEVLIGTDLERGTTSEVAKRKQVRLLTVDRPRDLAERVMDFKPVGGGLLVQTKDSEKLQSDSLRTVTDREPTKSELNDLEFAWLVAKHVKSNAIVFAKDQATVGVGAGQMNRVLSAKIARMRAEEEGLLGEGAVMASDAFFPFRDSIDAAADAGITAVIQPGGSIRDDEVIAAADQHNVAMVFTGTRHFKH